MEVTSLAMAAVAAFVHAVGNQLGEEVIGGFKTLLRRRFSGDGRAESALAAVERDPSDAAASQLLTQALAYYAARDSDFRRGLGDAVNYMEYNIDQSRTANWNVGGHNYGSIQNQVEDNRVTQSGEYVAGRDLWIDRSRVNMDFGALVKRMTITGILFVVGVWVVVLVAVVAYSLITGKPLGTW